MTFFYLERDILTHTIAHEINTDSAPINVRLYRLSEKHKEEVNQQIKKMLQGDIISHRAS